MDMGNEMRFKHKVLGLLAMGVAATATSVEAADAPAAFKACQTCHKVEAGAKLMGPSLFGIAGRKAGTVADFAYSDVMKNSGITWDDAHLSAFIADPKTSMPGTKMVFAGLKKPDDVAAVVTYLKTLK